jgi:5-carboxymethyl-2-hydroxymuconate isomerase
MKMARIKGSGAEYPIGKIVCLARNYVEHIRELGNETPDKPVLFMKPATAVIGDGEVIRIPAFSLECHHEVELAVLIGKRGKDIPEEEALGHVAGYGVALDMTLRDVQNELKKKGLPWEIAKGFDTSCPLSDFAPSQSVADPQALRLRLEVNGAVRQDGTTDHMINPVRQIVSYVSSIFTLEPGDVILTGTPSGVGPVRQGDRLQAELAGLVTLGVTVA